MAGEDAKPLDSPPVFLNRCKTCVVLTAFGLGVGLIVLDVRHWLWPR